MVAPASPVSAEAARVAIPLRVRLRLGRAAVQTVAAAAGVDLLHIKGDAVRAELQAARGTGTDIDVMIRPPHLARFDRELRSHGWRVYSTFRNGSPFGHAQTYQHDVWGYLDLHRLFPGIGAPAPQAFDRLWRSRQTMDFAGIACAVPGPAEQALILILNAARGGRGDLGPAWYDAPPEQRAAVAAIADELDASVAFDAALGRLDRHRGDREYLLWRAVSQNGTRLQEWRGRLRAAPTLRAKAGLILRALLVNTEHLAHRLGRPPSRGDVVREFFARPYRGLRELRAARRRTRKG